ncbi:MAG: PAAR-like domain-containing protein [Pseudomonadota bacterium]
MPVSININGLSLCHKASDGVVRNTLPDVCKTPPANNAPIPYPNIAFSKDLAKGTTTVTADGGNMCANLGSEFSVSIGDEPGSGGGVKSGVNLDRATWLSWSPDVFMESKPVCRLSDKMLLNKGNTVSLGGLDQPPLTPSEIDEWLCDAACECANVSRFQQCVAEKVKEHLYDGDYPSEGSRVWSEVSMRVVDGAWQVISNTAGTGPTSNPITPRGGIRPDIVTVDSAGNPTRMIEMKFPGDRFNANQNPTDPNSAYNRAADDLGVEYEQIDVEDDCPCWGNGPPGDPVPVEAPAPMPQPDEEWGLGTKIAVGAGIVGGAILAGIAISACAASVVCAGAVAIGGGATLATQ